MGIATNVVKKAFGVYDSQPNNGRGNKAIKAKLAPAWAQQPVNANSVISTPFHKGIHHTIYVIFMD